MRSLSPEPPTEVYHDRQPSANPQEFAVVDGVLSYPTSLSPQSTPGRAPQLVSSTLQHPLTGKSPQLLANGSPQALPPAYTRQSEIPSAQPEQPYWSPPPPASPSHANAHMSQQQDHYQQYQHQPYPLPDEQPSSMWTQTGVSHPDDFLQHQQSINYSPGITGSPSDAPHKPVYITSSPSRIKRTVLWRVGLFIVMVAIVLGLVFGVFLKDKGEDQKGGVYEDISHSRTTTAPARATGTWRAQPTSSVLTPTEALGSTTTTQPPAQTQPPATSPPTNPATCMSNCNTKFYDCLDACDAVQKECEAPCGNDLFCSNPCAFKNGDCRNVCHSNSRRCQC